MLLDKHRQSQKYDSVFVMQFSRQAVQKGQCQGPSVWTELRQKPGFQFRSVQWALCPMVLAKGAFQSWRAVIQEKREFYYVILRERVFPERVVCPTRVFSIVEHWLLLFWEWGWELVRNLARGNPEKHFPQLCHNNFIQLLCSTSCCPTERQINMRMGSGQKPQTFVC